MKEILQTAEKKQLSARTIPAPAVIHSVLRSSGKPLDAELRNVMEPRNLDLIQAPQRKTLLSENSTLAGKQISASIYSSLSRTNENGRGQ